MNEEEAKKSERRRAVLLCLQAGGCSWRLADLAGGEKQGMGTKKKSGRISAQRSIQVRRNQLPTKSSILHLWMALQSEIALCDLHSLSAPHYSQ